MKKLSRRSVLSAIAGGAVVAAHSRSWAQSNVFDVRKFGATGQGTTNETHAIQAAIDAAHNAGGGVVFLPAGVYLLDSAENRGFCLNLKSRVTLQGNSSETSTLKLNTSLAGGLRVQENSVDVTIERIRYDGARDEIVPEHHAGTGICGSNGVKNFKITDCEIVNVWGRSFMSNGQSELFDDTEKDFVENILVQNIHVRNAGQKAIQIRKSRNAIVRNCIVEVNPKDHEDASAVEVSRSIDVRIHNNIAHQLKRPLGPGYRVVNSSRNVVIQDCRVKGAREGCVCIDAQKVRFHSVYCEESVFAGALIGNNDRLKLGLVTEDVVIDNCTFDDPGHDGIVVNTELHDRGPRNVTATNNKFIGRSGKMNYGLRLAYNCGPAFEYNNTILNARIAPIGGNWLEL